MLSVRAQLSFTLPYYIVISVVSAIIHTFGYSLIFRAKATPGGLEIITSYLLSKKRKKVSTSSLARWFGISVVFFLTIFNFAFIEENKRIKKNNICKEVIENLKNSEEETCQKKKVKLEKILKDGNLDTFFTELRLSIEKFRFSKSFFFDKKNELDESDYRLALFLKNKVGKKEKLLSYPQELDYYLSEGKELIDKMKEEVQTLKTECSKKVKDSKKERELMQRKEYLERKIIKLKEEQEANFLLKFFRYVTNNERL